MEQIRLLAAVAVLLLAPSLARSADLEKLNPYRVTARPGDPKFEVRRGPVICDGSTRVVSIRLGSVEIPLGHVSEGCATCGGMDPEAIAVHRLPGGGRGPDLLHVEWAGGAAGARGQEDTAYRIVLESDPISVLASGRIRPYERLGGQGPMWMDSYRVSYRDGVLGIEETLRLFDVDIHEQGDHSARPISETVVDVSYDVGAATLSPAGGRVRHRVVSPSLARSYEADESTAGFVLSTKPELMHEFGLAPAWETAAGAKSGEFAFDIPRGVPSRLAGPKRRPAEPTCPELDLGPAKP